MHSVALSVMATNEDWWGYLIFVFFIVVIVIFVIKILLQFPGLLEWRFVCSDLDDDNSEFDVEMDEVVVPVDELDDRDEEMRINKHWTFL